MNSPTCNETHLTDTHKTAIYLISCALKSARPEEVVISGINHERLYEFAVSQKIDALLGWVLGQTGSGEMTAKWKEAYNKSVKRTMLFDAERAKILSFLEEKGIWYMPLKGILIKDLYPVYGMRQMADNDILFDYKSAATVKGLFTELGYETVSFSQSNHDIYYKLPFFNFEMHRYLFRKSSPYFEYYYRVKNRLIKDADNDFGYHFSEEDFYIYIFLHFAKHLHDSGTGIRSLTDLYLYRTQHPELNDRYISEELSRFGLAQEEQFIQDLVHKLFSKADPHFSYSLYKEKEEFLLQFLNNGTYGNLQNQISNHLNHYNRAPGFLRKLYYIRERLLPDLEEKLPYYPAFFSRNKWIKPFFYIYRIFNRLVVNRRHIWKEIKLLIRL